MASKLGITVVPKPVSDRAEIESAIGALAREPNSGLVALPDVFMSVYGELIFALALQAHLPTVGPLRSFAEAGALGPMALTSPSCFAKPRLMSIVFFAARSRAICRCRSQPSTNWVINLKTAAAIGLVIPSTLLATADDVIE